MISKLASGIANRGRSIAGRSTENSNNFSVEIDDLEALLETATSGLGGEFVLGQADMELPIEEVKVVLNPDRQYYQLTTHISPTIGKKLKTKWNAFDGFQVRKQKKIKLLGI